ncbi:MAG: B12-binding domain-containing radical SAM protein [Rhodospirillales bacterium]|nr:B12-binding domain-containing radical SAM protein [Rhodospirillales bacterium]
MPEGTQKLESDVIGGLEAAPKTDATKVDILLIATKSDYLEFAEGFVEWPLGLMSIAGPCLDAGYSVKIIDQRTDQNWKQAISDILNHCPICVGLSSMSGPHLRNTIEVAEWINKHYPDQPIVVGGPHATMAPEHLAGCGLFDVVVPSEGEEVFLEIVQSMDKERPITNIKGIYFQDGAEIRNTGVREALDVNQLAPLPYHLLDVNHYNPNVGGNRSIAFFPDRGCPHRCAFCNVNDYFYTRKARMMSAEALVDHMKKIVSIGVDVIAMGDSNFLGNVHRIKDLVDLLEKDPIPLKIKCSGRVDDILRIHDRWGMEMLERMKAIGFIAFQIGVESGSDDVLEYMDKKITVEQVRRANDIVKKVDVIPLYSFMGGSPHETAEDGQMTLDLMVEVAESNPKARMTNLQLFRLLPGGTKFWKVAEEEFGVELPKKWEDWFDLYCLGHPWLAPHDLALFKKWDLISYFITPLTVCEYYPRWWVKILAPIYSRLVKFRIRHRLYDYMPEMFILEWLRKAYIAS